ncbi:agmatine deiminase family protein [Campylobacter helveticus]|uniref:Agamatine deiminase n=1 Tax=Campylobacter helveticus TaxID=28898 RepID=A0ABY3L0W6_9BACT|nr:agmatine deiminase family protein [Campylobacter helveticus]ARE80454.1 agmatine deiminase [Campylobacter helveticus]MCR2039808.1 agmatine deiminase family protein [Campylobacter helveticus]MCR2054340.1 agmatine deiminase family protein [Campylobacter helveticus]MCR2057152.1 agmatine deiminase family protein [Campylobacter helveticus]MCR2062941.1 agmatine deiminase family protein [Campylobacter helveticus]
MINSIAEWSEQECLMLALPHKNTDWKPYLSEIIEAYKDFVKCASRFEKLLLIAPNDEDFAPFKEFKNVEFFKCETNDTWIRDFGAIDVLENGKLKSLNFTFNAWGDKFQSALDNALNDKIFKEKFQTKLEKCDFILEGGSIEFNGVGVMLTSSYCLLNSNRNKDLNKEKIEEKLKDYFGLKKIIWLENGFIKGDDTDRHIDTLARFIDENTIAYCICEDEKDEHYLPLKAMEEELMKTGFKLVPLPIPKPLFYEGRRLGATYANFVFVNNALIVPFYGDENDEIVRERLQNHIKNREVVGVDARVFLRQNGSLHCSCQNRFKGKRWI